MNVRSGRNYSVRGPLVLLIPRTSACPPLYPQLQCFSCVSWWGQLRTHKFHLPSASEPAAPAATKPTTTASVAAAPAEPTATASVASAATPAGHFSPAQPTKAAKRPPETHRRDTPHSARGSCCAAGGAAPLHGADDPATRHAITCAGKIDRNTESIVGTLVCLLCNRPR